MSVLSVEVINYPLFFNLTHRIPFLLSIYFVLQGY